MKLITYPEIEGATPIRGWTDIQSRTYSLAPGENLRVPDEISEGAARAIMTTFPFLKEVNLETKEEIKVENEVKAEKVEEIKVKKPVEVKKEAIEPKDEIIEPTKVDVVPEVVEPATDKYDTMLMGELRTEAKAAGINTFGLAKDEIIDALRKK